MTPAKCHPTRRHHAKGLCYQCYSREWQRANGDRVRAIKRASARRRYAALRARGRCSDCARKSGTYSRCAACRKWIRKLKELRA